MYLLETQEQEMQGKTFCLLIGPGKAGHDEVKKQ